VYRSDNQPGIEVNMFSHLRTDNTGADLELSEEAKQLLESLDLNVRPVETAKRFPRIVNHIAALWKKPSMLDSYFVELMLDQRGDRTGFTSPFAGEIAALQEYYSTVVYPKPSNDIWDFF
jgi:hypothetical protein